MPGAFRSTSPEEPSASNRTTQPRTIRSPTPPIRAAIVRLAPAWVDASARRRRVRPAPRLAFAGRLNPSAAWSPQSPVAAATKNLPPLPMRNHDPAAGEIPPASHAQRRAG